MFNPQKMFNKIDKLVFDNLFKRAFPKVEITLLKRNHPDNAAWCKAFPKPFIKITPNVFGCQKCPVCKGVTYLTILHEMTHLYCILCVKNYWLSKNGHTKTFNKIHRAGEQILRENNVITKDRSFTLL